MEQILWRVCRVFHHHPVFSSVIFPSIFPHSLFFLQFNKPHNFPFALTTLIVKAFHSFMLESCEDFAGNLVMVSEVIGRNRNIMRSTRFFIINIQNSSLLIFFLVVLGNVLSLQPMVPAQPVMVRATRRSGLLVVENLMKSDE